MAARHISHRGVNSDWGIKGWSTKYATTNLLLNMKHYNLCWTTTKYKVDIQQDRNRSSQPKFWPDIRKLKKVKSRYKQSFFRDFTRHPGQFQTPWLSLQNFHSQIPKKRQLWTCIQYSDCLKIIQIGNFKTVLPNCNGYFTGRNRLCIKPFQSVCNKTNFSSHDQAKTDTTFAAKSEDFVEIKQSGPPNPALRYYLCGESTTIKATSSQQQFTHSWSRIASFFVSPSRQFACSLHCGYVSE